MKRIFYICAILCLLASCHESVVSDDPALQLTFSKDTLRFDTVFSQIGSSTLRLMVHNGNRNALSISKIWMQNGQYFRANVDGEPTLSNLTNYQLNGGDSLYVFVRVYVDPLNQNSPVLLRDSLCFAVNGKVQHVFLEAYGQDVHIIRTDKRRTEFAHDAIFNADNPYLLYDTVLVGGKLILPAGTRIYFHEGASLWALGDVDAQGTLEQPILIRGDRCDRLWDSVPYLYAAGQWDGFYLINYADAPAATYHLNYVNILSGNIGLYVQSERKKDLPLLTMTNCRVHNHTLYGLVLQHINATIANTEISNCASYCVYLSGGEQQFVHTTIASYFNNGNIYVQNTTRKDQAAVYIDNLNKECQTTTSFCNSIITGVRRNQLVVATPLSRYYPGTFIGNYLKTDTLSLPNACHNVYWQENDSVQVFRNDFYSRNGYRYFDFQLDSLSPALGIADSITALSYPTDRLGIPRIGIDSLCPDAGCYQHIAQ